VSIWNKEFMMRKPQTLTEELTEENFKEIDNDIINKQRLTTRRTRTELLQKFKREDISPREFESELLKIYRTRFQDSRTTITVSFRLPPELVVFADTQVVNGEFVNRSEMVRFLIQEHKKRMDSKTE